MNAVLEFQNTPALEHERIFHVLQTCLAARSHLDVFRWLQGEIQTYLPHDILVVAWGDRDLNELQIDIISALPGVRTQTVIRREVMPLLREIFAQWKQAGHSPFSISRPDGFELCNGSCDPVDQGFGKMHSAVAHGINDERGHYQCLYIAFSQGSFLPMFAADCLRALVPYIDVTLRQLDPFPQDKAVPLETLDYTAKPNLKSYGLTQREVEIMEWVSAGKTNEVIGIILNISPFTVKNHLKRIFQKLGVTNRAQAVSRL